MAKQSILLTGATGFVGQHLYPRLCSLGHHVVCATRHPQRARRRFPGRRWARLDLDRPATIKEAMRGCDSAYFLIHGMGADGDYEARELRGATAFLRASEARGLKRVIYLGGVEPIGPVSKHLRSRLATGRILRSSRVPTLELRAAMIVGAGSESWCLVRDLSARLPVMILPPWARTLSAPVALEDVLFALTAALGVPLGGPAVYGLPGPEWISLRDVLVRTAHLLGRDPVVFEAAAISPRLAGHGLRWATRARASVSRELVMGLLADLSGRAETPFWSLCAGYQPQSFEQAARAALAVEASTLSIKTRVLEHLAFRASRKHRGAQ